jgi:hypothetical protein
VNPKNLVSGPRPDITPPQGVAMVIAGIPILAELLRAFGIYDLDGDEQEALSNAVTWASVFASALIGGDAVVRTGRNVRQGRVESVLAEGGEGGELEIVQASKKAAVPPPVINAPPPPGTTYNPTGFEEPPPPR